jgi:hypothetical protein
MMSRFRAVDSRRVFGIVFVVAAVLFLAPSPRAQNLIPPDESVGSVPDFGGTGLFGEYYDNAAGYSSSAGSPPEATFTASNVCFPDCQGGSFSDGNGGLAAFTNGNASNINFSSIEPVRLTWDNSEIDMSGYIAITTPGTYFFYPGHDDNLAVTIGGVTESSGCCGVDTIQDTFTAAGLYRISMLFQESGGGSYMSFTGTDPNGQCILGCYDGNNNLEANDLFYSDTDLQGAPAPVIGGGWPAVVAAGLMGVAAMRRRLRA